MIWLIVVRSSSRKSPASFWLLELMLPTCAPTAHPPSTRLVIRPQQKTLLKSLGALDLPHWARSILYLWLWWSIVPSQICLQNSLSGRFRTMNGGRLPKKSTTFLVVDVCSKPPKWATKWIKNILFNTRPAWSWPTRSKPNTRPTRTWPITRCWAVIYKACPICQMSITETLRRGRKCKCHEPLHLGSSWAHLRLIWAHPMW